MDRTAVDQQAGTDARQSAVSESNATGHTIVPRYVLAVLGLVLSVVAVYNAKAVLPFNVVNPPGEGAVAPHVATLIPQGWAFFTKSPRDEVLVGFRRDGDSLTNVMLGPHSRPRNSFGLDRASRAQGVESALFLDDIPVDAWVPCTALDVEDCDPGRLERPIPNVSPSPTFCGDILLVLQRPVPWAYRDFTDQRYRPTRTVEVYIQC